MARATVYLRWPTRSALIGAAARAAVGGQPMPLSGDLETDLRFAATFIRRVFQDPTFTALLPEIVRGAIAGDLAFDQVAPRRPVFARQYGDGAAAAGFDTTVDANLPFDMLLGTAISHLLANRRPMTEGEANSHAEVVIRGLRR